MLGKMWGDLDDTARQPYMVLHEESKRDLKARQESEGSRKGGDGADSSALVEELRRELKACKEELRRSGRTIERLTNKVHELRRTKHTIMKREKRLVEGKDKSLVGVAWFAVCGVLLAVGFVGPTII